MNKIMIQNKMNILMNYKNNLVYVINYYQIIILIINTMINLIKQLKIIKIIVIIVNKLIRINNKSQIQIKINHRDLLNKI